MFAWLARFWQRLHDFSYTFDDNDQINYTTRITSIETPSPRVHKTPEVLEYERISVTGGHAHLGDKFLVGTYDVDHSEAQRLDQVTQFWTPECSDEEDIVDGNIETPESPQTHHQPSQKNIDAIQMQKSTLLGMMRRKLEEGLTQDPRSLAGKILIVGHSEHIKPLQTHTSLCKLTAPCSDLFAAEICRSSHGLLDSQTRPSAMILCTPDLCNPRHAGTLRAQIFRRHIPDSLLEYTIDGGILILAPTRIGVDIDAIAINDFFEHFVCVPWRYDPDLNNHEAVDWSQWTVNENTTLKKKLQNSPSKIRLDEESKWLENVPQDYLLFRLCSQFPSDARNANTGPFVFAPYGKGFLGWFGCTFDQASIREVLLPMLGLVDNSQNENDG